MEGGGFRPTVEVSKKKNTIPIVAERQEEKKREESKSSRGPGVKDLSREGELIETRRTNLIGGFRAERRSHALSRVH